MLTERAISFVEQRVAPPRLSPQAQEAIRLYVRPDPDRQVQRRELALVVASAVVFALVITAWAALEAILPSLGAGEGLVRGGGEALLVGVGAGLVLHLVRYYLALARIFRRRMRHDESHSGVEVQKSARWLRTSSDLDVVLQSVVVGIVLLLNR